MSEYTEVEQPFLHQLQNLGWQVIDQGPDIPADPAKSLRHSFRQWILPEVFVPGTHAPALVHLRTLQRRTSVTTQPSRGENAQYALLQPCKISFDLPLW